MPIRRDICSMLRPQRSGLSEKFAGGGNDCSASESRKEGREPGGFASYLWRGKGNGSLIFCFRLIFTFFEAEIEEFFSDLAPIREKIRIQFFEERGHSVIAIGLKKDLEIFQDQDISQVRRLFRIEGLPDFVIKRFGPLE